MDRQRLRESWAEKVKKTRREEGEDPRIKPTHEWLRDHDLDIGLRRFVRDKDMTGDEAMIEICGFEPRPSKSFPGHSTETKRLVNKWLNEEQVYYARLSEVSCNDAATHLRKCMNICLAVHNHANLLRIARMDKSQQRIALRDLFNELEASLGTQGSARNYGSTLVEFFDFLEECGEIDAHCADSLLNRFSWSYERDKPEYVLSPDQVHKLWDATQSLAEKVLIILLFACGFRPSDILGFAR